MTRVRGLAVCALLAAAGCRGDVLVTVTGRVVEKGGGYVAGGDETLDAHLRPADGGKDAPRYTLQLAADGGFTIQGPSGSKLPPGRYAVVFTSRREGEPKDKFNNRYAAGRSPLTVEVTAAPEQRFTIDLTAGTVTPS